MVKIVWEVTRRVDHSLRIEQREVKFDIDIACDETHLFVLCGSALVALALDTGDTSWTASLQEVGGALALAGKTVPMVSAGLVVINTAGGTAAFRAISGQLAWFYPKAGTKTVYDNRVDIVTTDEYYALDLVTGHCLLQAPLAATTEAKWRLKSVQFSSHLAVSETHGFIGDTRGRLYAFERLSGQPVWMDRPEGITGFSGNIPVIAGNRLYISSFSMAPAPPPRLYCYEVLV